MTRYRAFSNSITPAIPYVFLSHGGAQSFDTTGFHIWDDVKIKTSHFIYTASTDKITLETNSSGLFKIDFNCTFQNNDPAEELTVETCLYKNGIELNDSSCEFQHASGTTTALKDNISISYVVYLEKGDYVQVFTTSNDGEILSSPGTSRLIISFIPMSGWDNSSAGREDYKGGIVR